MELERQTKRFLDYCAVERQLSINTLEAYGYDLADFRKWLPKQHAEGTITTDALREYLEDLSTIRKFSASTIRRRFACLRSFFRYLEDEETSANPFSGWRLKLPRRRRLPRALSQGETSQLLGFPARTGKESGPEPTRSIEIELKLMVATGIRVGELCSISTSDVWQGGAALRIRGKGSRDRLVYVADPNLRQELVQLASLRLRTLGQAGPLFVNRHGTRLRPHSVRAHLRVVASKVGLKRRITPHMLRHTAATLLIERGVDIRIVQRLLGHSTIATTEIYTHVSDDALRKSLERANILGCLAA